MIVDTINFVSRPDPSEERPHLMRSVALAAILAVGATTAQAADLSSGGGDFVVRNAFVPQTYRGVVTALDGRTIEFYPNGPTVRIADVDVCNLPQYAFERFGYPYPCGPLGKAWLKRIVRLDPASCTTVALASDGVPIARCEVRGRDLGFDVVRAGIGKTPTDGYRPRGAYAQAERNARRQSWGLNDTTYLDPSDWRRRAEDRSLDRQPFRDRNMIRDRLGIIHVPTQPRNPAAE